MKGAVHACFRRMNSIKQAIITLGGKGSRLESITKGMPKPLYPINGLSTLERAIQVLNKQGITKFIFFINFKSELFKKYSIKLSKKYGMNIQTVLENETKGEAGSIFDCIPNLDKEFLFINGDIIFDFDLKRFQDYHFIKNSDITIMTHLTNHPEDSDCIIESPSLSIAEYKLKNNFTSKNSFFLGIAGISIISKEVIIFLKNEKKISKKEISLFGDIVINLLKTNFQIFSYNTSEYLKDMGTPTRLKNVKEDLKKNIVLRNSYRFKQKVLFLDRDETLIKCPDKKYILKKKDILFYKERIKKISKISKDFNFCLIISNQPQISMGLCSWQDVIEINGTIINKCQSWDLQIAGFYICPHHPHAGFKDEIKTLKTNCFCRKPYPGLILEAAQMRNIDLSNSLFIGDSKKDLYAAKNSNTNFLSVFDL